MAFHHTRDELDREVEWLMAQLVPVVLENPRWKERCQAAIGTALRLQDTRTANKLRAWLKAIDGANFTDTAKPLLRSKRRGIQKEHQVYTKKVRYDRTRLHTARTQIARAQKARKDPEAK